MSDLFSEHNPAPLVRDISRDISRGRANPQSAAAFDSKARWAAPVARQRILALLREHKAGLTSKEIASRLGTELHKISGRLSELRQAGRIRERIEGGETLTRDGAAVLVMA